MTVTNKSIIIRLIGGLGNQLFQLQYALNLQQRLGVQLYIDDSFLEASHKEHESIAVFDLIKFYPIKRLGFIDIKLRRTFERLFYSFGISVPQLFKPKFHFEGTPIIFTRTHTLVIDGFWQNSKNLNDQFIDSLRVILSSKHSTTAASNAVCVHIRRGDYLTNTHWFKRQQIVTPLDYYLSAFNYFKEAIDFPIFEIFTDDEPWAIEAFKDTPEVKVIPTKSLHSFELLAKMTSYQNFITTNSTLSWWAAVASNCPHKEVLLPKIWGVNLDSSNYQLPGWIAI